MSAPAPALMLRTQDLLGHPLDMALFPSAGGAVLKLLFTPHPHTLVYWPVFRPASGPGDRVFDRASKRLLYGQAAIYRNIVGRVNLACVREWPAGHEKGLLRLHIAEDGWLVAAVQRFGDKQPQPCWMKVAPLYAMAK